MAKDVDLSSDEWRELVFEGKNKEFGAYELRKGSPKRHNMALVAVAVFIIVVLGAKSLVSAVFEKEEEAPKTKSEQAAMAEIPDEEVVEDEIEEIQQFEEPEPVVVDEPVLETEKVTEWDIKPDEEVTEPPKSQEQLQESTTAAGVVNQEGIEDLYDQKVMVEEVKVEPTPPPPPADDQIFVTVEQEPQFPGGQAALLKWISDHIKYPTVAQENNIQGKVTVQFVVTKTGSIGEVRVVRGKDPDLDKEAVRVVKSLPKFTPGKMNGHPVNVWYTLPITFKLQGI